MAVSRAKLDFINETHKDADKKLDNEIELIFGKPSSLVDRYSGNGNLLDRERSEGNRLKLNGNHNVLHDDPKPTDALLGGLREPDREKPKPPLAGPEIDDLDGDFPKDAEPYPGIDDGLLEPAGSKPHGVDNDGTDHDRETPGDEHTTIDEGVGTDGKLPWEHDEPDFPYDINGFGTRFNNDGAISPVPGVIPDVNTYQQKKNLAQGMMDLALLSANANQLRYVLESATTHPYYYPSLVFISLSIIFQVLVGVGLIMNSQYDVNVHKEICKADKINNMTVLGIFLITIVNVFITSFSVSTPTVSVTP